VNAATRNRDSPPLKRLVRRLFRRRLTKQGDERLTDLGQLETCCLQRCVNRTVLLELLDHVIEIGIAGAKAPCEPVPTALGYPLAVSDNLELTGAYQA